MRMLEALLLITILVALAVVALPRLPLGRWRWALGFLPAFAALVQLAVEGFRWQMVPAYALAVLIAAMGGLRPRKLAVAASAVLLTVAVALPLVVPVFRFPLPSGTYSIGTRTYHWVDESRADFGDPSMPRETVVLLISAES